MAATISVVGGRVGNFNDLSAVKVSIDANGVSYATSLGGLALDLYTALSQVRQQPVNGNDVVGILPLGMSSGGYLPTGLTLGTVTSSSVPVYVRLVGIGASATAAGDPLGEAADGANTQTFTALILVNKGGSN